MYVHVHVHVLVWSGDGVPAAVELYLAVCHLHRLWFIRHVEAGTLEIYMYMYNRG